MTWKRVKQRWILLLISLLATLTQAPRLRVEWLTNLAVLHLFPVWLDQRNQILDPPCVSVSVDGEMQPWLETTLAFAPEDGRLLTHLGRVLWLQGRCTEATSLWREASAANDTSAMFELFRVGDLADLSPATRLALAKFAYHQGQMFFGESNTRAAKQWFRRAFDLAPQRANAEMLAMLETQAGNTSDVADLWRAMADELPETEADHWWALGRVFGLRGEWESAARAFEQGAALVNVPTTIEFWIHAGRSWEAALRWEESMRAYQAALQARPDDVRPYHGLGNAYRSQGQYVAALKWYFEAEKIQADTLTYFYLGLTYYQMKDYVSARQHLDKAIALDPKHAWSRYYLAQTWYADGNFELAETSLLEAIRSAPVAPASWWIQMGDWRVVERDCVGAREAFGNALVAGGDDLTIGQKMKTLNSICDLMPPG